MQVLNLIKSVYKKQRQYENLDLDYITPRIIAMSYPGNTIMEILKHNNITDVSFHLKKYHNNNYTIYNLSGIPYDISKFDNQVKIYYWKDHHAPPLFDLFNVILSIKNYLSLQSNNIVCVHCLAGKGRTGVVIICLLIFCNVFINDAIDYFSIKRKGKRNSGVQQPSQLRYINFFYYILFHNNFKSLELKIFEIIKITISGLQIEEINTFKISVSNYYYDNKEIFNKKGNYVICGDFIIYVKGNKVFSNSPLCWICFHTSFLLDYGDNNINKIVFGIRDIDPYSLQKNEKYLNLKIEVLYKKYNSETIDINNDYENDYDISYMVNSEKEKIEKLNAWIKEFRQIDPIERAKQGEYILFGGNQNDINNILILNP